VLSTISINTDNHPLNEATPIWHSGRDYLSHVGLNTQNSPGKETGLFISVEIRNNLYILIIGEVKSMVSMEQAG
jgi:hypothetical protein